MPIPDAQLYGEESWGAGKVTSIDNYRVNGEDAGADLNFGQAVILKGNKAVPASAGKAIFGVVLAREYTMADDFVQTEMDTDHWVAGNRVPVMREGDVSVPVSEDVNAGENAAVDADGNFKAAGSGDTVVGTFNSNGAKNGTASLEIHPMLSSDNADSASTSVAHDGGSSASGSSSPSVH